MRQSEQEFRGEGIILRTLTALDAPQVLQFYEKNKEIFNPYEIEKPSNFYTLAFQRQLLNAEQEAARRGQQLRLFLFDEQFDDTIIGTISFSNIKHGAFEHCSTGYKIDSEYFRMGYGTRMLTLATFAATHSLGLHRIEAYIQLHNLPSIHLARRCGYHEEGIARDYVQIGGKWEDHLRYVYIADEYQ